MNKQGLVDTGPVYYTALQLMCLLKLMPSASVMFKMFDT